ncbi:hypothetical protein IW261DRAFT_1427529 [Armillaria novae-zelandiae]|uniref:Uncharacterized protein n=1 Tax=Armillaria novae-zelandiae TaxID=153914 RepID=A0AA39NEH3_9AGAR|nr:hypothetical protein IW261DRAFT_1427529 [Armillaria novae-zelandiae]
MKVTVFCQHPCRARMRKLLVHTPYVVVGSLTYGMGVWTTNLYASKFFVFLWKNGINDKGFLLRGARLEEPPKYPSFPRYQQASLRTEVLFLFHRGWNISQVAEGVVYLHSINPPMVNAGIRATNILVLDDVSCCLADSGVALNVES